MNTPKVYIAGQDVFRPNQAEILASYKRVLTEAGFIPLSPMDNEIPKEVWTNPTKACKLIYEGNIAMVKECDIVLANCNDFRGDCIDDGTAFEIGMATAYGKVIFGYRGDHRTLRQRLGESDKDGWNVEDFGNPVNLMIARAIWASDGEMIKGNFGDVIPALQLWAAPPREIPDHHHVWCNGQRGPVKGCLWCDPKRNGKYGLWAKYPYDKDVPKEWDKLQEKHFPNVIPR